MLYCITVTNINVSVSLASKATKWALFTYEKLFHLNRQLTPCLFEHVSCFHFFQTKNYSLYTIKSVNYLLPV